MSRGSRNTFHSSSRGIARRSELIRLFESLGAPASGHGQLDPATQCFLVNNTTLALPAYSVVQISAMTPTPSSALDRAAANNFHLRGITPTDADVVNIAVTQRAMPSSTSAACLAVYSGVTILRISGPLGQTHAAVVSGSNVAVATSAGQFEIIYDFAVDGAVTRLALVRFAGSGGDAGSSTGGGAGFCSCSVVPAGGILIGSEYWAENYEVVTRHTGAGGIISHHPLTWQGSYWESDDIEHACEAYPEGFGDTYRLRLNATGTDAGDVELTVFMTSGANCGNAGCCPSLSGGFTQSYVNRHAIDQLATFELHRNKSGFTGVHCDPGSCVVCVRPLPPTPTSCSDAGPTHYRLYFDTDATGDWPAEMLSAPELLQNVRGSGGAECSDGSGGCFYMANDGFQYRGLQGSLGCDLAPSFDGQLPYWQLALKQLPATAPCQWHIALIGHMKPNGGVFASSATYSNTTDRSSGAADTNCFSSPPVSNYPMEPFRLQRTGFNNDNGTTGEPPTSVLVVPV